MEATRAAAAERGLPAGLQTLVDRGALVLHRRPEMYVERRRPGAYEEPREVWVLGTLHTSEASAAAARELVEALRPEAVVVELCRSRAGLMLQRGDGRRPMRWVATPDVTEAEARLPLNLPLPFAPSTSSTVEHPHRLTLPLPASWSAWDTTSGRREASRPT